MMPSRPRHRLSGLLTVDILRHTERLPLSFPEWALRTVASAIAVAWTELQDEAGALGVDLASYTEPEITTALQHILNKMRRHPRDNCPSFSGRAFQHVARDASVVSFDATSLEKAPDLTFREVALSSGAIGGHEPALFAEAKIVTPSRRRLTDYCTKGIMRFVKGEYAWYMDSGLMLAYVREGASDRLSSLLATGDDYNTASSPSEASTARCAAGRRIYFSVHRRDWRHLNGASPGDISLSHLWLD